MDYKQDDLKILEKQLERKPRNVANISKRCQAGYPQVIVTAPILDNGIFPTTFWLTCPELNYRISQLEDKGGVKKVESKIQNDQDLTKELEAAHESYAQYRLDLISEQELKKLAENSPGQYRVIKESGVGGIMNFSGIKCLHTHYAHYLATGNNPVGELVDQLLAVEFDSLKPENCSNKCHREG